ncbi:ankyrin repeat-containing domain protein [Aspergillus carlsbadensis]|nr:ankyrin repeat-containing domain protein [Aspergillus carlsbadensis]
MAQFNLFKLPEELILNIIEYLPAADLASFLTTSKTSWRIAIRTAEIFPIGNLITQFKDARKANDDKRMLALLPIIRHVNKNGNPSVGYEALIQSCMGTPSAEAVWLLVNDGVPYDPPSHITPGGLTERYECTPIIYAVRNTNPAALLVLLDFIAKAKEWKGSKALCRTNGYHGAVVCPPHAHAQWALHCAVESNNTAMVERLLAWPGYGVDVNYTYSYPVDGAVLLTVAKGGSMYILEVLLKYGADIHARHPRTGWSALHFAAAKGHWAVLERLLEVGADVNYAEPSMGHTPLLVAAGHGHAETVAVLLQRGARINHPNIFGRSALSIAAAIDDSDVVSTLLDYGADIQQVCRKGRRALSYAGGRDSRDAVEMLASAACLSVNDHAFGMGPLDYTTRRFYKRGNLCRDSDIRELAEILGYELSGDAERDAYRMECEFEAYVDFDLYDPPLASDDEDDDAMETDGDGQA